MQGEEASKRLLYVQDVARILRENVVQGQGSKEDPNKLSMFARRFTTRQVIDSVQDSGYTNTRNLEIMRASRLQRGAK